MFAGYGVTAPSQGYDDYKSAPCHMKGYRGSCLCGALRYEALGTPVSGHCYCADCRKASGSAFIPFLSFPSGAVTFSGEARQSSSPSASGWVAVRNFCPICGGLVFAELIGNANGHTLYAGSLDEPSLFKPAVAIFTQDCPPWALIRPGLTQYRGLPEECGANSPPRLGRWLTDSLAREPALFRSILNGGRVDVNPENFDLIELLERAPATQPSTGTVDDDDDPNDEREAENEAPARGDSERIEAPEEIIKDDEEPGAS